MMDTNELPLPGGMDSQDSLPPINQSVPQESYKPEDETPLTGAEGNQLSSSSSSSSSPPPPPLQQQQNMNTYNILSKGVNETLIIDNEGDIPAAAATSPQQQQNTNIDNTFSKETSETPIMNIEGNPPAAATTITSSSSSSPPSRQQQQNMNPDNIFPKETSEMLITNIEEDPPQQQQQQQQQLQQNTNTDSTFPKGTSEMPIMNIEGNPPPSFPPPYQQQQPFYSFGQQQQQQQPQRSFMGSNYARPEDNTQQQPQISFVGSNYARPEDNTQQSHYFFINQEQCNSLLPQQPQEDYPCQPCINSSTSALFSGKDNISTNTTKHGIFNFNSSLDATGSGDLYGVSDFTKFSNNSNSFSQNQYQQALPPQQTLAPNKISEAEKVEIEGKITSLKSKCIVIDNDFPYFFSLMKLLGLITGEFRRKIAALGIFGEDIGTIMDYIAPLPIMNLQKKCDMLLEHFERNGSIEEIKAEIERLEKVCAIFSDVLRKESSNQSKIKFTERIAGILQVIQDVELFEDTSESAVLEDVDRHLHAAGVPNATGCTDQAAFDAFFTLYNTVILCILRDHEKDSGRSTDYASVRRKLVRQTFDMCERNLFVLEGNSNGDSDLAKAVEGYVHFNTLQHPSGRFRYTLLVSPGKCGELARYARPVSSVCFCKQEFEAADDNLSKCVSELRRSELVLWYTVLTDTPSSSSSSSSSFISSPSSSFISSSPSSLMGSAFKRKGGVTLLYAVEHLEDDDFSKKIEPHDAASLLASKGISQLEFAATEDCSLCPAGTRCLQILDRAHATEFWHPTGDLQLCDTAPFKCATPDDPGHLSKCMHVCGDRNCHLLDDASHTSHFVHPPYLSVCACGDSDPTHLAEFHGQALPLCCCNGEGACPRVNDAAHRREAYHVRAVMPPCATLNSHKPSDFALNMAKWKDQTTRFLGVADTGSIPSLGGIEGWLRNFRSVHQCSATALESIVRIGAVASLDFLQKSWADPAFTSRLVMLVPEMRALEERLARSGDKNVGVYALKSLREYVQRACRVFTAEMSPKIIEELNKKIVYGVPVESLKFALSVYKGCRKTEESEETAMREADSALIGIIESEDMDTIKRVVREVLSILANVYENARPIDFDADKEIGTDKNVFAIHGPNMGKYGDAEVAIVFHEQVAQHPDTFFTPIAAMGYYQGWYIKNSRVGSDRPWAGADAKFWSKGAREEYEASKFQQSTRGWTEAAALELIARVVQGSRTDSDGSGGGSSAPKTPADVTLEDVQRMWRNADPHMAIEAHLPGLVPLDYVERVIVRGGGSMDDNRVNSLRSSLERFGVPVECVPDTVDAVFDLFSKTPYAPTTPTKVCPSGYLFTTQPRGNCAIERAAETMFQNVPMQLQLEADPDALAVVMLATATVGGECPDLAIAFKGRGGAVLSCVELPPQTGDGAVAMCVYAADGRPDPSARVAGVLPPRGDVRVRVVVDGVRAEVDVLGPIGVQAAASLILPAPPAMLALGSAALETTVWDLRIDHQRREDGVVVKVDLGLVSASDAKSEMGGGAAAAGYGTSKKISDPPAAKKPFIDGGKGINNDHQQVINNDHQQVINNDHQQLINNNNNNNDDDDDDDDDDRIEENTIQYKDERIPVYGKCTNKLCNNLFDCKLTRDAEHTNKFMHVCLYGVTCRDIHDKEHTKRFYHIKKNVCPKINCPGICDPIHRATYNHQGEWDFMMKCRHGKKCTSASKDPKHRFKYHHEDKEYKHYYEEDK